MLITSELSAGQQLAVWSGRTWMAGFREKRPVQAELEDAYRSVGIACPTDDIDELFGLIVAGARRVLSFGAAPCPFVHPAEAVLVNCLSAYQSGCDKCGKAILGQMLNPAEAFLAMAPVQRWAGKLGAAGWSLSMVTLEQLTGGLDGQAESSTLQPDMRDNLARSRALHVTGSGPLARVLRTWH
ncbi:MAG: hypothetical protein KDA64_02455 [Rhodospirillaceae bacterium]|nr:hypothetical protein [Rhodospirillaceae bacterium]